MSIFRLWRQLGRRYFWPHLLLGMVAASVGLPAGLNNAQVSMLLPPAEHKSGNTSKMAGSLHHSALQVSKRHGWYGVDSWQTGVVFPGMVRHFSFSLVPQIFAVHPPSLPLTEVSLPLTIPSPVLTARNLLPLMLSMLAGHLSVQGFAPASWLSQVCGIRAGPADAISLYG